MAQIETTQRYVDKAGTVKMPRCYNVHVDGVYSGYVTPNPVPELVAGAWVWSVPDQAMWDRADRADVIAAAVALDAQVGA